MENFRNIENQITDYDEIKEIIENNLPHSQWKISELLAFFKKMLGEETSLAEIDESGCTSSYAFLVGIFKSYGYIDIYFLRIPYGEDEIYITGVTVSK